MDPLLDLAGSVLGSVTDVWRLSQLLGLQLHYYRTLVSASIINKDISIATVGTIVLYFAASLRNPGFIQGNTLYEVAVSQ